MKLKTVDGWKELGYHVKKGEKAMAFDQHGKALFKREQTEDSYTFSKEDTKIRRER